MLLVLEPDESAVSSELALANAVLLLSSVSDGNLKMSDPKKNPYDLQGILLLPLCKFLPTNNGRKN
jgi:hypothetical protein